MTSFRALLEERQITADSLLCVGLDPRPNLIPACVRKRKVAETVADFSLAIASATASYACCFKPNWKFFLHLGGAGLDALTHITHALKESYPDVPIIVDSKTGDAQESVEREVEFIFDTLGAHALTVFPQPGMPAFESALFRRDKAVFALCRMSNPGSGRFQERVVIGRNGRPMKDYEDIALEIAQEWDTKGNCGLVVGATNPVAMERARLLVGDEMPILSPGFGSQQGNPALAVPFGIGRNGRGLIASVTSAISFASSGEDFAEAAAATARRFRDEFNTHRVQP